MDGVVRSPSAFSMTRALPPSMIATHELVVPRSIPMILPMRETPENLGNIRQLPGYEWDVWDAADTFNPSIERCVRWRPNAFSSVPGDHDQGRPQQAIVEQVALLEHLDHAARRRAG